MPEDRDTVLPWMKVRRFAGYQACTVHVSHHALHGAAAVTGTTTFPLPRGYGQDKPSQEQEPAPPSMGWIPVILTTGEPPAWRRFHPPPRRPRRVFQARRQRLQTRHGRCGRRILSRLGRVFTRFKKMTIASRCRWNIINPQNPGIWLPFKKSSQYTTRILLADVRPSSSDGAHFLRVNV